MNRVTVYVNTDRLDELIRVLPGRMKAAVDETGFAIRDRAEQIAPRDTGSLAASLYVTNGEDTDYWLRTGQAAAVNDDAVILEEIRPDSVISLSGGGEGYMVVVGAAVEHGEPVEFGTRFMAAQPFMTPSVEPERDEFITRMSDIADV